MRAIFIVWACLAAAGCDDNVQSNVHPDFGIAPAPIGAACAPDTPPTSACGYWPQFYCGGDGRCSAACTVADPSCPSGSVCVGAGVSQAGHCQLADGGADAAAP